MDIGLSRVDEAADGERMNAQLVVLLCHLSGCVWYPSGSEKLPLKSLRDKFKTVNSYVQGGGGMK